MCTNPVHNQSLLSYSGTRNGIRGNYYPLYHRLHINNHMLRKQISTFEVLSSYLRRW